MTRQAQKPTSVFEGEVHVRTYSHTINQSSTDLVKTAELKERIKVGDDGFTHIYYSSYPTHFTSSTTSIISFNNTS
jgi:hypothetical protein